MDREREGGREREREKREREREREVRQTDRQKKLIYAKIYNYT